MAKYRGSPWGEIRGKLFDHVGGIWKGIRWTRFLAYPTQRGTLENYRLMKDGLIPPSRFSYPQFNIRRVVLQVLGYIARFDWNLSTWIYPVWEALCDKRSWVMTGTNAFVRTNASRLFATMPHNDEEYDPVTNTIDLTKMLVSDGDLESATPPAPTAVYDTATGKLTIEWNPVTYTNGDPTDLCNVIVAKKPLLVDEDLPDKGDWRWYPQLFIYPFIPAPPPPAVIALRADGTVDVMLPSGLDAADLTAYLFFRDAEDIIGYSPSVGFQVVAGP